jgi:hypothetical protein
VADPHQLAGEKRREVAQVEQHGAAAEAEVST